MIKNNGVTRFDGAGGTLLWDLAEKAGLPKEDVWKYNITSPETVAQMHRLYIEAGADMIQTNTFAVNRVSIARAPEYTVKQIVSAAIDIALKAAEGTEAEVYLDCGPLPVLIEPYGLMKAAECAEIYGEIMDVAAEKGIKTCVIETFMDLEMMKVAAAEAKKRGFYTICSMSFEKRRRTMMGNTVEQFCRAMEELGVDGIGTNCSHGPVQSMEVINEFHEKTHLPLYFKPNAGVGESCGAEPFASEVAPALEFVSFVGGCCGSDPSYISALRRIIK